MNRYFGWLLTTGVLGVLSAPAHAIPSKITYQGTMRENGVAISSTVPMSFQITGAGGVPVYWKSNTMDVEVKRGVFAASLDPTGVDWQSITPYIQVSIRGQALDPVEPINASVYAHISANVIDGAITPAKLSATTQDKLIPTGLIAMFAGPCPAGWVRFNEMDNKFPYGAAAYGATGGSDKHTHVISNHAHPVTDNTLSVGIGIRNVNWDNNLVFKQGVGIGNFSAGTANEWFGYGIGMSKPAPTGTNAGNVGVSGPSIWGTTSAEVRSDSGQANPPTGEASTLPSYLSMVFCRKL